MPTKKKKKKKKKKKNFEYLCAFYKNIYDFLVISFYIFWSHGVGGR
jgi:hypothetical protein